MDSNNKNDTTSSTAQQQSQQQSQEDSALDPTNASAVSAVDSTNNSVVNINISSNNNKNTVRSSPRTPKPRQDLEFCLFDSIGGQHQTTDASITEHVDTNIDTSTQKRARRTRKSATPASSPKRTKKKTSTTPKSASTNNNSNHDSATTCHVTEREFATSWICCECREAECMLLEDADTLIICEGTCRRLFHYPCAGLERLPPEDETWMCSDCRTGQHACAICQQYGRDQIDVFLCGNKKCGLFFHEACLVLGDINFTRLGDEEANHDQLQDDSQNTEVRLEFTCPAHACWTCSWKPPSLIAPNETTEPEAVETPGSNKKRGGKRKRKKSKSSATSSIFEQRTGELMRCLECPMAYHVGCIPPSAKFHELALLCQEHAKTHKLPDLDEKSSFQGSIEAKIDSKYAALEGKQVRMTTGENKFLGGLSGSMLTNNESRLLRELLNLSRTEKDVDDEDEDSDGMEEAETMDFLPFCLPCEMKDEVHSKPPSYKHVNTLRYNVNERPPRTPMSEETCHCINGHCGEDCLNRMLYVECIGDKGAKNTNCVAGKDCGNRRFTHKEFVKCKPAREQGKGWGLVPCEPVPAGALVIEYVGEVINESAKENRMQQWSKDHPNDPNFYIMSLSPSWYIDAREVANLSRFINHSCDPNCSLTPVNVNGYMRNGIFAKRDIPAGEFLSYDYRFETGDQEKFICRCGSKNCRGTMKESTSRKGLLSAQDLILTKKRTKTESLEHAKKIYSKELTFVHDFEVRQSERMSQVQAMVPSSSMNDEYVANGVQNRYRSYAPRLFLWRNAKLGSNLDDRLKRLPKLLPSGKKR